MAKKTSGQEPFRFSLCDDLYTLPERARPHEVDLHGGFADDTAAATSTTGCRAAASCAPT